MDEMEELKRRVAALESQLAQRTACDDALLGQIVSGFGIVLGHLADELGRSGHLDKAALSERMQRAAFFSQETPLNERQADPRRMDLTIVRLIAQRLLAEHPGP